MGSWGGIGCRVKKRKPRIKDPHPLTYPDLRYSRGLVCRGKFRIWFATYAVDGVRRFRSLETSDEAEAIRRRDEFHEFLESKGAIAKKSGRNPVVLVPGSMTYIRRRKPWAVYPSDGVAVGRNVPLGLFETLEEAMAFRDAYYGVVAEEGRFAELQTNG